MIFNAGSRARVREAERLWVGKFVLRVLCWFSSLIALIIAGVSFSFGTSLGHRYYRALGLVWLIIPVGVSLIWNAANIIVRLSRPRPMHPGANVGMDLVLWLAFIVALVFSYADAVFWLIDSSDSYYCSSYNYSSYGGSYTYDSDCEAALQRQGAVDITACVFGTISLILHFTLFVWACVDTHRRNNMGVDDRAAQMAANMVAQMQGGGHQSMPPQGYYPPQQGGPPMYGHPQYPQQAYGSPQQAQYGASVPAAPPGVGPAYAQHQTFHDANSSKAYPQQQTRDVAGGSLAPGQGASADGHSPAPSSVSPVARSDENQPEVATHQPKTY